MVEACINSYPMAGQAVRLASWQNLKGCARHTEFQTTLATQPFQHSEKLGHLRYRSNLLIIMSRMRLKEKVINLGF